MRNSFMFRALLLLTCAITAVTFAERAQAADVFVRVKVLAPAGARFRASFGGHRHAGEPWQFPETSTDAPGGAWSAWVDLRKWPWHGRLDREGGLAEWPSMMIGIRRSPGEPVRGCSMAVQLADAPDAGHVVHDFTETSESNTIGFLVPTPLRAHAAEFETGSQMVARQLAWAKAATGNQPIRLKQFTICTSLWDTYDPGLARGSIATLRQLGFNVIGADPKLVMQAGARVYRQSDLYLADPEQLDKTWKSGGGRRVANALKTAEGRRELDAVAHWVLSDEIRVLSLSGIDADRRDEWFRDYLKSHGVSAADLGQPLDHVHFPANVIGMKSLPRDADLPTRRLLYYGAKFGQWWSARELRHSTDLIHASLATLTTETLPTDHGFFNAWGPPTIGMSAPLLDLFELGSQQSVDQLSAEDWLGLNHMYGPASTWTGAQSFEYLTAIMRSAIGQRPMLLRGLITPSDDGYLRLKAYSALGQGAKSFFFWTFGPTYIGTENYWSDLHSEYTGLAKLDRALEQAEPVLYPARSVRDPVAILYSVSHDIWHSDDPAAFVEKRLLWHALRHLHVQPDFIREEDVTAGALAGYKALYVTDQCIARNASARIDAWVRAGGTLYLSAGAATRDEFFTPYIPPFARQAWPDDAASRFIDEHHSYSERTDLPGIKPIAHVQVHLNKRSFDLPAIGCRLNLRTEVPSPIATFDDGKPAGAVIGYGGGKVVAVGFMPMLAYGQLAHFHPTTLQEKWPSEPRELARLPLELAHIAPVAMADVPVVETSLLTGPKGSALVLANYTYQPIASLKINVHVDHGVAKAISTSGSAVQMEKIDGGVRLTLPLKWTDIILLRDK